MATTRSEELTHEVTTIATQLAKARSDVTLREVLNLVVRSDGGMRREFFRVRLVIRSNSYRDQCSAQIDVWRGQWHEVHSIEPECMNTAAKLSSDASVRGEAFALDRAELLRVAAAVLHVER